MSECGEPFSVIKPSGVMWPCPGEHCGTKGRGTWVMEGCVNKADCLIGCKVMNFVIVHSLKGRAVVLLTCG